MSQKQKRKFDNMIANSDENEEEDEDEEDQRGVFPMVDDAEDEDEDQGGVPSLEDDADDDEKDEDADDEDMTGLEWDQIVTIMTNSFAKRLCTEGFIENVVAFKNLSGLEWDQRGKSPYVDDAEDEEEDQGG